MKSLLKAVVSAVLVISSYGAVAQEAAGTFGVFDKNVGIVTQYDYNVIEGSGHYKKNTYAYIGLRQPSAYGTINIGAQRLTSHVDFTGPDEAAGWQIAYNYPYKFNGLIYSPSVQVGRVYGVEPFLTGKNLAVDYYKLGFDVIMPVSQTVAVFAAVARVTITNTDLVSNSNRFTTGADYFLTPTSSVRIGYSRQWSGKSTSNGITTGFVYNF